MRSFRNLLQKIGIDIVRYRPNCHALARRMKLLSSYNINLILDIGANTGQYAKQLRTKGYQGKIVSFEPLKSAYEQLVKNSDADPLWLPVNIALGNFNGKSEINVSKNSYSSSILNILPASVNNCPEAIYIKKEEITVKTLDSIINDYYNPSERLFVKIDTQGFEKQVIDGAILSLPRIIGIEMELSIIPLYSGETLFGEMLDLLSNNGYTIMGIDPAFCNSATGQILQVDCIFFS